jgi:hypothetical protein
VEVTVRIRLLKALMAVAITAGAPASAAAQQDEWQVSAIPYLWLTDLDGELSAGSVTVPVLLKFADAVDHLAGAFSFHLEASRGRWGVMTDLNFIRLSSSSTIAVAGRPIEGTFELDNVMFEMGGSYLLQESARFGVIAGLRTYTVSPKVEFSASNAGGTLIDKSETSPNAFVGFILRPNISDKWIFIGRGDIGGGDADLTWSGVLGFEYRVAPWGGLEVGYQGLGIDIKSDDRIVRDYQVIHHGPIFGFRFHWGG